jgi:hypothetical protein
MTPKNHKALLKNVASGKGYRFSADKIEGAGFFGDIAKTVGKKVAKAAADKGLDYIGDKTGQKGITDALKGSVDGLVDVAANKVSGGKLVKGSPEMRAHMAKLCGMRRGKGMQTEIEDGNIGDDIRNGWNRTFNPKLERKIKDAFTGDVAKSVYKGIADIGLSAAGAYTGLPLGIASDSINSAIDGAGIRRRYKKKNTLVIGGTLVAGVPHLMKMSSNPVKVGGSFRSAGGTLYGGSFGSP